jgi:hypothetical protein
MSDMRGGVGEEESEGAGGVVWPNKEARAGLSKNTSDPRSMGKHVPVAGRAFRTAGGEAEATGGRESWRKDVKSRRQSRFGAWLFSLAFGRQVPNESAP